jgi:osmotically-inducible protein OsmY
MNKFNFNIGATVHCKNGKCGKLQKLVVDPENMEVTNLIVSKGLILREDRVVPVSDVDRATEEYVMLSINDKKLENYPEYRPYNFDVVGMNSKKKTFGFNYISPRVSPYGFGSAGRYLPVIHRQSVHMNVPSDQEVIERGTSVHNQRKKIGNVDHVLVDAESGCLTHIVVDLGIFTNSVVFPISITECVDGEGIFINIDEEEIDQFPEYSLRDDSEIIKDLRKRIKSESFLDQIEITADDGVVKMDGSVPDIKAKRRLEYEARTLEGIVEVENNLLPGKIADSQVLAALANDPRTEFSVIEVIEDRNTVTLRGQVDSVEILQAAIEIAETQPGVLRVINGLSVKEDRFTAAFVTPYTRSQLAP